MSNDQSEKGLYQKYEVRKDGKPVENCFVLEPESDDAALAALKEYARETEADFLAADLADWIVEIEEGSSNDDSAESSEETERTEQRAVNVLADETGRSREEFEPDFEENPLPDMDEIDWGPARRSLEEGEPCPECEHPFDSDEWDVRHINGPSLGEDWIYTCPNCEQETCMIGI